MNQHRSTALLIVLFLGGWGDVAIAQVVNNIVPDTTLGGENSIITPDGAGVNRITGGATRGSNLFHSLQNLTIGTNQTAWFDNPLPIQNILVRVTGGTRSDIDGVIRANGTADLFLINPNGFIFGQNAKLNIGGAFSALTTTAIPLGDQGFFSVATTTPNPLLAVKPSALFDLTQLQPQANIQMNADWQTNGPTTGPTTGQTINLVGRNIEMTGRLNNVAAANQPTTLSLRSTDNITLNGAQINNPTGTDLYVAAPNVAPVRLVLQVTGNQGDIRINNTNIGLYGGAFEATAPGAIVLNNTHLLSQNNVANPAAPIVIQGGSVALVNRSSITVPTTDDLARADRVYQPAVLDIRSQAGILIDGSRINQPPQDAVLFPGEFAVRSNLSPLNIRLEALQNMTVQNSVVESRGGAIQAVTPGDFFLLGSQLYSDSFMAQDAAPIKIQAQNIRINEFRLPAGQELQSGEAFGISSNTYVGGDAALIDLAAKNDITIRNYTGIGSNTLTTGNAGSVVLNAGNQFSVVLGGVGNRAKPNVVNGVEQPTTGNNGDLTVNAKDIEIRQADFSISHFSQGGGGRILINAQDTITLNDGGALSNAAGSARGADIIVRAGQKIDMQPQSGLDTKAEKQSQGGNIIIETDRLFLRGSITTNTKGAGNAGNISIKAAQTIVDEGKNTQGDNRTDIFRGTISSYTGTADASSNSTGNSGNIQIQGVDADSQILLQSGAGIVNTVFKDSQGNTGKIDLQTGTLDVQSGSQIIAVTDSFGSTGLIDIQARRSVQLSGGSPDGQSPSGILSTIQTSAQGGSSQGIQIKTPQLVVRDGAAIITSTLGSGNSGAIDLTADQVILTDRNLQGNSSGILTSVGLGQIPVGKNIISITDGAIALATLNPLVIRAQGDSGTAIGDSGNIALRVGNLDVRQGAQVVTVILGAGTAGNVSIQAQKNIRLDDRAAIRADSGSGNGGSINLNSNGILLLRRGSEISAVSRAGGTDGNINITAPFLVALPNENSDIFAISADALNGGRSVGNNIQIVAQNILGFDYRPQFTSQNDIISTGSVTLNLPDIDPSRGLTFLPIVPVDVAQKIDRICSPNSSTTSSSFINQGPGGLPAAPTSAIAPNTSLSRLAQLPIVPLPIAPLKPVVSTQKLSETKTVSETQKVSEIREAQGFERSANGKIHFWVDEKTTEVRLGLNATCW
jgi:filamentous hemagglutinin family protein